jgi:hypothetical protein
MAGVWGEAAMLGDLFGLVAKRDLCNFCINNEMSNYRGSAASASDRVDCRRGGASDISVF